MMKVGIGVGVDDVDGAPEPEHAQGIYHTKFLHLKSGSTLIIHPVTELEVRCHMFISKKCLPEHGEARASFLH